MSSGRPLNSSADTSEGPIDQDALQLQKFGYRQSLKRNWGLIESFAASFSCLNFVGSVRSLVFLGLQAGGPAAMWSSYLITAVFMTITAAVLAEICSALPLSGSIYIWAAEAAGPKHARLAGTVVVWWICTGWMTSVAALCQLTANYIVSEMVVYGIGFPGGIDNGNIKWRAFIWAFSEAILIVSISLTYLPPKWYSWVFRLSVAVIMLDFFLCLIWLPIGVSRTYGFRSAKEVFTMTNNGTGAPAGWNWILCFLFSASTLMGFDASGHIAEETVNASVTAAKGVFTSALATSVFGFITTILFLFCTPDLDTLFALGAPQPFVQIYAMALGKGGSILMTALAALALILIISIGAVASSRLLFAVARDGVLPLSSWVSKTTNGQPNNAVTFLFVFSAVLLCTILPSEVAFTTLLSASGAPIVASYGLIGLLRLTMTPNNFRSTKFRLGPFRKPFYAATAFFNAIVFAVTVGPFYFPVNGKNFNFAFVIFVPVTILAVLMYWFTSEKTWLELEKVHQALARADNAVQAGGEEAGAGEADADKDDPSSHEIERLPHVK